MRKNLVSPAVDESGNRDAANAAGEELASERDVALAWLKAIWRADHAEARRLCVPEVELAWPGYLSRGIVMAPPWLRSGSPPSMVGRTFEARGLLVVECASSGGDAQTIPPVISVAIDARGGRVAAASWHVRFEDAVAWCSARPPG